MAILSGDSSKADMRSFYYSSSRTSNLTKREDDDMTVDDNINAINSIELLSTTTTTAGAVSVPTVIVPTTNHTYWRSAKGNHSNGISIDAKKNRRMHCSVSHRIHEG